MLHLLRACLIILLIPNLCFGAAMQLKEEGVHQGWITSLDAVGADITASAVGIQGTITTTGAGGTYLKLDCSNDPLTNTLDGRNFDFTGHGGLGADGAASATIVLDIDETYAFVDSTRYGCFTEIDLNSTGAMSAPTHILGWDVQARWVGAHDGSTHASVQGIKGEAVTWNCAGDCNQLVAIYGKANNIGQTVVAEAIGLLGFVSNDDGSFGELGDLTTAHSILSRAYTDKDTGVIATRYGLYIEDTTGGGLLTDQYGLYIEDMASGSASGTTYSIYSLGGNVELTDGNIATTGSITGNKLTANANLDIKYGNTGSGILAIYEDSDLGTDKATFIVPALAADTAYTLPTAIGGVGEQLTDAAGNGILSWAAAGGAGAVAWDDIADPDNDGLTTIDFDHASENTVLTNIYDAAGIFFKIDNSDAALANEVTLLGLEFTDVAETNGVFLRCYDNNGDVVWQLGAAGRMVIGPGVADYALPTVRGAANEVLTDNGGGAVFWAAPTEVQTLAAVLALGADANDLDITSIAQLQGVDAVTYIDMDTTDIITTKGNLIPSANGADDLGTDALEYNNAWFDGTMEADAITEAGNAVFNTTEVATFTGLTSSGTINIDDGVGDSPSLFFFDADNKYLALIKYDTGAGSLFNNEGAIRLAPSNDSNDYLEVSTAAGIVTITTIAGDDGDLVITAGGGEIGFGNENLSTTGTFEAATITEGGNAVYSSGETPSGELGGTYANITVDSGIHDDEYLQLSGSTMTGDIQLGETDIKLDAVLSGDATWSGIVIAGTSGVTTLAVGDLCYLNNDDSEWYLVDANLSDGYDKQLGICVLAAANAAATEMLIYGKVRSVLFDAFTVGAPLYMSESAGDITLTAPTTTDAATRIIGIALTAEDLMFNPSNDYYTHT